MDRKPFFLAWGAYLLVTFPLGFLWHLVLFHEQYRRLAVYTRLEQPIFALGILAMLLQGAVLAAIFPRFFEGRRPLAEGLRFGLLMGVFFGSGTVIAEVAKQNVTSLPLWFLLSGSFVLLHFSVVGGVFGWIFGRFSAPHS
ncbi:MAG: hypothetical protein KDD47_28245 [Acidobacteria bacterium]|nr:hypothetical protein [Acidobacteriota bacterium]